MLRRPRFSLLVLPCFALAACGDDSTEPDGGGGGSGGGGGGTCDVGALTFEAGDENGHADPFGAKAAGQARAGRVQAADVEQPAANRQKVEDGDFVLVNDKVAVFIEDKDISDGYGRFGGEIIAVDRVGADGKPLGLSKFIETLQLTSLYMIDPESVSVTNDGSNGEAAVVRVAGTLKALPFLEETFGGAFPKQYAGLSAAYDFVLEPGAEKISVRIGIVNPTEYDVDTGLNFEGSWDLLGFFQGSMNKLFLPGRGYAKADTSTDWVGFDNDSLPFAYQGPDGGPLDFGGIDISGFSVFSGQGFVATPCSATMVNDHEVVIGEAGAGIDGLGEVVRRANGLDAWRTVTGVVSDADGEPVAGAFVHALEGDQYINRVETDEAGAFTIHLPEAAVSLVAQKRGYPEADPIDVGSSATEADLAFGENGFVHVVATDQAAGTGIPVRIQVIPVDALSAVPESYGDPDEVNGRLWQEFSVTGEATLAVPPGSHRIVVSRGYEWEILDTEITVGAGETAELPAALVHSVDTTGAMSADFHIHSMYSADSSDPVIYKVRGALADGVDIPVSSEHEWIISFADTIADLDAEDFAAGFPGQELTTFTWGHFGVVNIEPRPELVNNGAIDWLGKVADDVFKDVHALPENPALIVNHPSGSSAFSSYFTKVELDRATGSSTHELWSEEFDAIEVFNDSDFESNRDASVADWFALLNSGKPYYAVGSSDTHSLRTSPIGYPRTYMFLGYDDPKVATGEDVRDAIKEGNMVVTGGLYMTVTGPNGEGPGQMVNRTTDEVTFLVTVAAPSWVPADSLEVIVNGETVETVDLLPIGNGVGKQFANQVTITLPDGPHAWVVFHAKGEGDLSPVHPGRRPFAVSNPVTYQR